MPQSKLPPPKGKTARKKAGDQTPSKGEWASIIGAVKTPLGFFALTVLAAEAIIGLTIATSGLNEDHKFWLISAMLALLFLMIALVGAIAVWKPGSLSPEMGEVALKAEAAALKARQEAAKALNVSTQLQEVIGSPDFQDQIGRIIEDRMRVKLLPAGSGNEEPAKTEAE